MRRLVLGSTVSTRLVAAYIVVTVLRLVLAAGQPIEAIGGADHDDGLFVRLAINLLNGEWLGPYTSLTLAKGPGYPLFLAASFWFGLPLHFTETLLYVSGCGALVRALRPYLPGSWWALSLFAILSFCPSSFEGETYRVLREGIYPALTLWTLAGFIGLISVADRGLLRFFIAIAAGALLYLFLITREEGIWLSATIAVLLAVAAYRAFRAGSGGPPLRVGVALSLVVMPLIVTAAGVQWLKAKNAAHYGVAVVTEMSDGPFEAAYGAVLRVKHKHWIPYLPAPREARERISAVSPAFAGLQGRLEHSPFAAPACEAIPTTCGEVGGGWFLWAFRDAVRDAGHYASAEEAARFYERLATEVNGACDQGRLDCGPLSNSPIPPLRSTHLAALPRSVWRSVKTLLRYGVDRGARYEATASLGDDRRFAEIEALTRNPLSPSNATSFHVRSWAFHEAGPVEIKVVDLEGAPLPARIVDHLTSPDVVAALDDPAAANVRYEASFNGPAGVLQFYQGGRLIGRFTMKAGQEPVVEQIDPEIKAPLGDYKEKLGLFDGGGAETALSKVEDAFQQSRAGLQRRIVVAYAALTPALAALGLAAYLFAAIRLLQRKAGAGVWIATALLGAIAARVLLISLADVTSMPSVQPKHFTAVYPLIYVVVMLCLAAVLPDLARLVSRLALGKDAGRAS